MAGLLSLRPSLLPLVFHDRFGCFGYKLEFAQRTFKFIVRVFCYYTRGVSGLAERFGL